MHSHLAKHAPGRTHHHSRARAQQPHPRPKKKLTWDPRPPKVYIVSHSSEELALRKAHWRQIESDASRMAQSAGSVWSGGGESHPVSSGRNYGVD